MAGYLEVFASRAKRIRWEYDSNSTMVDDARAVAFVVIFTLQRRGELLLVMMDGQDGFSTRTEDGGDR